MYTVGPQFSGKFIQEKFHIFYSTCLDFYVIAKITSMFNFCFFLFAWLLSQPMASNLSPLLRNVAFPEICDPV